MQMGLRIVFTSTTNMLPQNSNNVKTTRPLRVNSNWLTKK